MAKSRFTDEPQDFREPVATAAPAPLVPEKEPEPVISVPLAEPTPEPEVVETMPTPVPEAASTPAPVRTGPICPACGSSAVGIAGGMRRCNQCGHSH